jgi:hypothetical protein
LPNKTPHAQPIFDATKKILIFPVNLCRIQGSKVLLETCARISGVVLQTEPAWKTNLLGVQVVLDFSNVRLTAGSCTVRKNITSAMTWIDSVVRQASLVMGNLRAGSDPSTCLFMCCPQSGDYRMFSHQRAETGGWLSSPSSTASPEYRPGRPQRHSNESKRFRTS